MKNNDTQITKQNLAEALTEVRKAYRLIYQFQDQLLKLINYIGSFYGLKYYGWWQKFSRKLSQRPTSISLDNWAWDWIPMYYSEFIFQGEGFAFSIILAPDTGWFDKFYEEEKINVEKLEIDEYETIENSSSLLIFFIEKAGKDSLANEYDKFVSESRHVKDFFNKKKYSGKIGTAFYSVYPLEKFYSLEATDKILKEFAQKAKKYGYDLKIKAE